MADILNSDRQTIHKFSTAQWCKVTIQLTYWFLTRRFIKFQPMRTHYGTWQPCWISNQHQKHKSGWGPSNEHLWQVWLKSVLRFQRRRAKSWKANGRTNRRTNAYPWQKLTWPMARWAKNDTWKWCKNKIKHTHTLTNNSKVIPYIVYICIWQYVSQMISTFSLFCIEISHTWF